MGANKFFNIDFGKSKFGQFINLLKKRMLEIDVAGVKSVTIKKN